ncbi:MAG: dihydrofolate reductase family protein, partial [Rubrobacter sp.]|nr:dihydrofolate reductase family protein [Rubrobacter sp.]
MVRPAVTVSYAQTLDGRMATADGSSRWISCPDSLRFAHALRAEH